MLYLTSQGRVAYRAGPYLRRPYTLEALGREVRKELDRVRTSPP